MKSDQKKDGENDKRKHKKIENLGESSQASAVPSSNVLFNEANELQGVLSNNDSNLSLDSASQQSETVTLQLPASSSMLLESTEAANKTLHDFALSPLVNDAIAQIETFSDAAARIQDAIKMPDVTDVVYQIQNYENTIRNHMDAIKVALPEIPKLSFPTLENSSLFNETGLSALSGLLTYKGKSVQELEQEEQQEVIKELSKKIEKQEKLLDEQLKDNQRKADELSQVKMEIVQLKDYFKHLKSQSRKVTSTDKGEKKGNIWFKNQTGAIWVSNVRVGELEPGSRSFHFFAVLFEFYPMTVDYPTLTKKILERLKKKTQSKTPQNYCQTVKSDIKRYAHRTAELIKDFTTEKGERGYRLISPERQKKPRN